MPALARQQKITFGEMRAAGVRSLLIYCADFLCSPLDRDQRGPMARSRPALRSGNRIEAIEDYHGADRGIRRDAPDHAKERQRGQSTIFRRGLKRAGMQSRRQRIVPWCARHHRHFRYE
jgi:hypothetical protein